MVGVHPQTLRLYEREGLLKPRRTNRQTRLYSETDIDRLKAIINLTQDMGVNLAGVEIILRMRSQVEEMQGLVEELLKRLYEKIQHQFTESDYNEMAGLVPRSRLDIQPVRTVNPTTIEGELSDEKSGRKKKNKS
jgi:MerR family transcriptional regulator/heat shock protein HspR